LDDFYSLALDKLDRFTCLKPCDVKFAENDDSSEDDEDDDEDDEDEDEDDEDDNEDGKSEDENIKPPRKSKNKVEDAPALEEVIKADEELKQIEDHEIEEDGVVSLLYRVPNETHRLCLPI
jgi:hypothetical protein